MGHGTFIFEGEFAELREGERGDWGGPVCDYVAKGWMDGTDVLLTLLGQFEVLPDLSKVERCYAHIGKDGCVFYHSEPGRGRFPVTHIERSFVKEAYGAGGRR